MDNDTSTTGNVDTPAVADTVATPTSEADVQVDNQAPDAAQAQEETPSVNATDTAEEKLYAGKYKSVDEMEKAYQELNSKFTSTTQEKAELSRILNDAFMSEVQPQAAQPIDGYDETDPVNLELDNLKRNQAVTTFIMSHPDAKGDVIQKVLTEDPIAKQIQGHEAKLEYAYLKSQSMTQSKAIEEARKEAAQATQSKIVEKQVAQVETASQASVQTDEKSELESRMASGDPDTRKAARMEYIKKYLV